MLLPHRCEGMGRHHAADTASAARLFSSAVAESAMVDGVKAGQPFRSDVAVQLQASLDSIRSVYPHAKCLEDIPVEVPTQTGGKGGKRGLMNLQPEVAHTEAEAHHVAFVAALLVASHRRSSQSAKAGTADIARMCTCPGPMVSA